MLLFRAVTSLLGPNADPDTARGILHQVQAMLIFRPRGGPRADPPSFASLHQNIRRFVPLGEQRAALNRLERLILNSTRERVMQYSNDISAMMRHYPMPAALEAMPQEVDPLRHADNADVRSDLSSDASGGSSGGSGRGTNATEASGSSASSILAGGERAAGARNLLELGQAIAQEDNGADVVPPREEP